MSAGIDWTDRAHWGEAGQNVHMSESGSWLESEARAEQ